MTENESINGWTFEETVKTAENLMETENNMFKWDVLRHLRDFAENFKEELEQYREIGTVEEIKSFFNENRKGGYAHGHADGYANAIDKFKAEVRKELGVQSNADRIRSMSDEELAEFINTVSNDSIDTITACGTKSHTEVWEDKESTMQWLQSEAE